MKIDVTNQIVDRKDYRLEVSLNLEIENKYELLNQARDEYLKEIEDSKNPIDIEIRNRIARQIEKEKDEKRLLVNLVHINDERMIIKTKYISQVSLQLPQQVLDRIEHLYYNERKTQYELIVRYSEEQDRDVFILEI